MKFIYTYFKVGVYTISVVQLSLLVLMCCGAIPWYYALLPVFLIITGALYAFTAVAISVHDNKWFDRSEMNNGGFIEMDEDARVFIDNLKNSPEPNEILKKSLERYKGIFVEHNPTI